MTLTIPAGHRCDWWRIVTDLQGRRSMEDIAYDSAIPRSTVAGFKNLDVEPKHSDGERLIALWCTEFPDQPVPVVRGSVRAKRAELDEMVHRVKCPHCGQTIRGILLEKWNQLRLHFMEQGGQPMPPAPSP
jgi:hypothetical protein